MASEVGVRDVARSHCLVDSGGDVALGEADQHVGHEVHEVERHERLQEGVSARICQEMLFDTVILRYCDIQSFPSHRAVRFFGFFLVSSPGLWAATAAS